MKPSLLEGSRERQFEWQLDSASTLPTPTQDSGQLEHDLARCGFCLVANAIPADDLAQVRDRLDEQALAEEEAGIAYFDGASHQNWGSFRDAQGRPRADRFSRAAGGVNQRLWMLVNKGDAFLRLLAQPTARALIAQVLGEQYILSSYIANIANPGGEPMPLHTDQWWAPTPIRRGRRGLGVGSITRATFDDDANPTAPMIAAAACCNIMWMLDDFTQENGATRVVPGSHLSGCQPSRYTAAPIESIAAEAPAGTAMVFEGRLWHGTGANVSKRTRRGLLSTFCGPQFRPQENYTVGISRDVLSNANDDLKTLLGFRIFGGYGRTDSPLVDMIDPAAQPVGIMKPQRLRHADGQE